MSHSNARGPRVFATLLPPNAHRSAEKSEHQLKQLNQEDVENIRYWYLKEFVVLLLLHMAGGILYHLKKDICLVSTSFMCMYVRKKVC